MKKYEIMYWSTLRSKKHINKYEIEVEEECVLDKIGNLIRRGKPKERFAMDPTIQNFINKHGGLAIDGWKFNIP